MTFRRWAVLLAPLLVLVPSGCLSQADRDRVSVDWKKSFREAATDYRAASAYEDARQSWRRGDTNAFERAEKEVKRLAAGDLSPEERGEWAVRWAMQYDELARRSEGERRRSFGEQAANRAYEVTQVAPGYGSADRDVLNSLGYILADRGTRPEHFVEAIRLTRASLLLWDNAPPAANDAETAQRKYSRALLAADSLAWALFKAGRHVEAYEVGAAALKDIRSTQKTLNGVQVGAVLYHVGQMHRALGRPQQANQLFREALKLGPDPETQSRLSAIMDPSPAAAKGTKKQP